MVTYLPNLSKLFSKAAIPQPRVNPLPAVRINHKVLFEPTSEERAMTIFEKPVELGIFPNHSLNMTTPNVYELRAMFKAAQKNGHFEDNEWRSLLDSFMLTSQFRQGTRSFDPD
jgi:hypothetical protein